MSDIYGFGEEPKKISLPKSRKSKSRSRDLDGIRVAAEIGEQQGFVDRSPAEKPKRTKLKPGRKRTEEQDRITIPGPKRVIERLRIVAHSNNVPVWRALEMALDGETTEL